MGGGSLSIHIRLLRVLLRVLLSLLRNLLSLSLRLLRILLGLLRSLAWVDELTEQIAKILLKSLDRELDVSSHLKEISRLFLLSLLGLRVGLLRGLGVGRGSVGHHKNSLVIFFEILA